MRDINTIFRVTKQIIKLLLFVIFILIIPLFSFTQEQRPPGGSSEPSAEFIIEILEKEKEKALKSGNKIAAESIDAQLKNFKSGKITLQQLMEQRPKEGPQSTSPQAGGYSSKGQPDAITGATPPEVLLQYLERDKEKALKEGKEGLAEGIEAMIRDAKAGKITISQFKQENIPAIFKPTPEEVIKRMEIDREKALQSGDKALVDIIDAQIKDLKAGKITVEQITGSSSTNKKELTPDMIIQILEKMKEAALKSNDIKNSDEIDMAIKAFASNEIESEKLYVIYLILREKLGTKIGEFKPISETDAYN